MEKTMIIWARDNATDAVEAARECLAGAQEIADACRGGRDEYWANKHLEWAKKNLESAIKNAEELERLQNRKPEPESDGALFIPYPKH